MYNSLKLYHPALHFQSLLGDHDQLKKQYELAKTQLEQETLLRTDLENKLQTLKEELTFQENVHREVSLKAARSVPSCDVASSIVVLALQEKQKLMQRTVVVEEEVETRTQAAYDSRLREELQAMREQSHEELEDYKNSMETAFKTKLTELRSLSERSSADALRSREELMTLRKRTDSLSAELAAKVSSSRQSALLR